MNNQKKKISTGVEDFKRIIDKNGYLVDKTLMIKDLLESNTMVTLFTRPRRFGKTLNQSMIRRFLEDEITKDGKRIDNRYLFDGLAISKCGEDILKHQQQYPVIFLSLKSARQKSYALAYGEIKKRISEEFKRHKYVLDNNFMTEEERSRFNAICNVADNESFYLDSLSFLSQCLAKYHCRNTIILLDEYDVPLEISYTRGFYDEMTDFIRSLFESALKTNPYLNRGIITGCLRISKESIFTGFNNLDVDTILHTRYGDKFGFTEEEVKTILEYYEIGDCMAEVKKWYDGYLFGSSEIYNPWSILKYTEDHVDKVADSPIAYWSNTSSNDIVRELAGKADYRVREDLEALMSGGTIEKRVFENMTYADVHKKNDNLWNFLFFSGYLKAGKQRMDGRRTYLEMSIPNEELACIYDDTISDWFEDSVENTDNTDLIKALEQGDCETAQVFINNLLKSAMSYFDTLESFYHGFMAGLLSIVKGYEVDSNKESGAGRPDIVLKNELGSIKKAIILEFKVAKSEKQVEKQCEEALNQIERKKYAEPFIDEGYDIVQKYAITFCQKRCKIKQGETYRKNK